MEGQSSCAYGVRVVPASSQGSGSDLRLGLKAFSWVFFHDGREFHFSQDGQHELLDLLLAPAQLGVLLDLQAQELLFYDPASGMVLCPPHASFSGPLFPVFTVADQNPRLLLPLFAFNGHFKPVSPFPQG